GGGPEAAQSLPAAGFAGQDLVDWLSWHQPRLRRRFERLVPGMLTEAAALGLFGGGALTPIGFLVEQGLLDDAAAAVGAALPAPVSRVVLQADLTAIAPGYLEPAVARELLTLSTPEGQGPATTYRFSADSIRRALDAGHDAASITAFLTEHSTTAVPQALTYLVEDTAGRYGSLRVGGAASYVRTEDDAVVAALLADPRAAALGLVQLAPTVIASPASPAELSSLLRDLGYAPAPEIRPGTQGRGPRRPSDAHPDDTASGVPDLPPPIATSRTRLNPWSLSGEEIEAQLASLRLRGTGPVDRSPGQGQESEVLLGLETLRTAIRRKVPVRLGTADSQGNSVRQILVPLSVSGGRVRVYDPQKQVEKVVSVHRVMDVEIVEGTPDD
ncbi:helicase-associated domain-containing protein, partial [Arthrobacter sp. H41]|uniref:helicase-associated domain-containing protein n=1 Tax=Arthrobacter sp. H41 TaxID=1312978 RepID=UPI00138B00A7